MNTRFFFSTLLFAVLSMSQASACSLKDARVCDIDSKLQAYTNGHKVVYQENSTSVPSIAAENEWVLGASDIIHLGDTMAFSDDELMYLVAHEYGHSVHRHGRKLLESVASPEDRAMPDLALLTKYQKAAMEAAETATQLNHQQEFEADAFAVQFMDVAHKDVIVAMRAVLKSNSSSATHPSRRARLEKAKTVLASLSQSSKTAVVSQ